MRTKLLAAGLLALTLVAGAGVAQAQPQTAFTSRTTNLRAGPAVDYPIVAVLPAGIAIHVEGCLPEYTWCDVVAGVSRGWVYAGNINYYYRNSYVPLHEYGPVIGIGALGFVLGDYWGSHYRDRSWYRDRQHWNDRYDRRDRHDGRIQPRGDRHDPRFVPQPHRPGVIMPPPPEPYGPRTSRRVPDGSTPIPRDAGPRHQRIAPDGSTPPPRVNRGQRNPVPDGSTPLNPAHQFN